MPEDQAYRKLAQRQRIPSPLSETTRHAHPQLEKQSEAKPLKIKSGSFKVPPAATKQKPFEEAGVCGFLRHDGSPALCQVQEQQGEYQAAVETSELSRRTFLEKAKECKELHKSLARLLRTCTERQKTIEGLRQGLDDRNGQSRGTGDDTNVETKDRACQINWSRPIFAKGA
ncbi:hypothetical protein MLD38_003835 [Melastoma candidum]|uniref:Uncharacterized protein n=1 Tax=Melastoma candidum TaxID=119954 RepID=A0ACB9S3A2_9MYRT|nr:hypothetical protein MLD38_003835 [Melastoma candidum]